MVSKFYYEKIPELRKLRHIFSNLKYKNIDLWPSMAPITYNYVYNRKFDSKFLNFLRILKFLFFVERFDPKGNGKKKIMTTFCIDRKNHHQLWNLALSSFKEDELITFDAFKTGKRSIWSILKRFSFRSPNLFRMYLLNRYLRNNNLKKIVPNKIDYLYFLTQIYFEERKVDYWNKIIKKYEPLACVSYSPYRNNDETILHQICKMNKIKTFAMQNYSITKFQRFNPESITYENFLSDYFLLWGESSKKILKSFIPEKKLITAGNPIYGRIKPLSKSKFCPKICTIFIGHKQYSSSNFDMIKLVNKFSENHPEIRFRFNIHIDNNRSTYIQKIKGKNIEILPITSGKEELGKLFSSSDFIIFHNTTMALEALEYQMPILQYQDKDSVNFDIPPLYFSNLSELNALFKDLSDPKSYKNIIKEDYEAYLRNFYQPKKSIPACYKEKIKEFTY